MTVATPEEMTAEEYQAWLVQQKQTTPKYGNKRTEVDCHTFDSKAEAVHYEKLRSAELGGAITDLRVHPRYRLTVNGRKVCDYEADFSFERDGETVVQDVKGARTQVYRIKRALMWACLGILIEEIEV